MLCYVYLMDERICGTQNEPYSPTLAEKSVGQTIKEDTCFVG